MSGLVKLSHALMVVGVALVAGGCRARSPQGAPAPTGGVGFELPGGAHVVRGAIITKPPGREESFLAFVAGGAGQWVDACREAAGGPSPRFMFQTDAHGLLGAVPPGSVGTARDRCLVARAIATPASGLPSATQVTVQLALR